jgi:phosphate transport system permease protein
MKENTDTDTQSSGSEVAERIRRSATSDRPYQFLLRGTALFFGAVIVVFVWSVVHTAWPAISTFGFGLVTGSSWVAGTGPYGALPLLTDTVLTTLIALVFAVPIGLASALALLFLIPQKIRSTASSLIELLAAVPSVVYGLWGLWYLVPWFTKTLQPFLAGVTGGRWPFNGPQEGFSVLLAGLVLSIMILPTIVAISRDVISVVPRDLIEGGLSLGATRGQVFLRVVLPSARTGILGAIALGAGRALGETIAVAMVIGSNPQIPHSLFTSGATLASTIATQFGEASGSTGSALAALALMLMVITASVNAGARVLTKRARMPR